MNTLYLLRHGETEKPAERTFLGRRDLAMTDHGCEQMSRCARLLPGRSIQRLFCSPLGRCRQSARIISDILGLPVEVEHGLSEIDLGSWDGLTMDAVQRQFPAAFAARGSDLAGFHPPGGESFSDLRNRVVPVFTRISRLEGQAAVIIAHAGVNRVILCHILGIPLQQLFRLGQDHGCINVIDCSSDPARCGLLNSPADFSSFSFGPCAYRKKAGT